MTTTIMFSGKEGKNSSRVLAQPGGKSNINLFGGSDETPAPARTQAPRKAEAPFATTPKAQDSGPAKSFKPVSSFNPVTGEPHSYAQPSRPSPQQQAPPQQQATPPQQQRQQAQQQAQASPVPQQASAVPQQQVTGGSGETKTSVKIYNPPGGKSSIQF